ncbi:MAG: (d)CMP kinase [Bacillota bacterium]|nr:(d)CMP kinase [Bacillota bacterium]
MENRIRIAVDGPAGAGKSTIAKEVAKELNIDYIDTGAMYRAIAVKLIRTGTDYNDAEALAKMLEVTDVDFSAGKTYLDGEDISGIIRTPEVSALASPSSAIPAIRYKLTDLQQAMGERKSVIMDGRDIGTVVFPDAEFKFYLVADPDIRAKRRTLELQEKGEAADFETVKADMMQRDLQDSTRSFRPLKKADDAIEIDTSNMSIEEVTKSLLDVIRK